MRLVVVVFGFVVEDLHDLPEDVILNAVHCASVLGGVLLSLLLELFSVSGRWGCLVLLLVEYYGLLPVCCPAASFVASFPPPSVLSLSVLCFVGVAPCLAVFFSVLCCGFVAL
ncbi:hypothetical protein MRB53_010545 [Persea americana]|uniref:Uncharacterized protein n=1 Tax=Persea americana TaxID=3435 RepID=A0ACC2LSG8_PERAE|nr:hypothetical protein MRB53_010545 [Persea americana]